MLLKLEYQNDAKSDRVTLLFVTWLGSRLAAIFILPYVCINMYSGETYRALPFKDGLRS